MLRFTLATSALVFSTVMVFAQASTAPAPNTASPKAAPSAPRGTKAAPRSSEFQALRAAKVSLAKAIETAEQRGKGRAIEADFEANDGGGHYEIKVLGNDGSLVEHFIDANSGEVTKSENQPFERYFTRLKPADFQNAHTSLKQAIAAAEQKTGGKVIEAEVDHEGDTIGYDLRVVRADSDKAQEVKVAADGKLTTRD